MFSNAVLILLVWLISLAIFFGFIILLRYLHHRERMALITQGIHPVSASHTIDPRRQLRSRRMLRAGLIIAMVGLSLTIGLYPVGFLLPPSISTPWHLGPWLLPGLIPLGVGIALIVSYYLEQNAQSTPSQNEAQDETLNKTGEENITEIQERKSKKRQES